jgi:2'-5' RNA ligase
MGIKEILFTFFLISAISIPFFFKQKEINIDRKINLPNIEIKKGYFKEFKLKLEKKGTFNKVDYICLLYTSPSPRDGLLSRMPSSA